jgi:uncharacterized protein
VRLYIDSSGLVARYFVKPHTQRASQLIQSASQIVTVAVTYVEVNAALTQIRHAKRTRKYEYETSLNQFELDWLTFERINVVDNIVYFAGQLARTHLLKGYDTVHLATALTSKVDRILTYDRKLTTVSEKVGLEVLS